MESFPVVATFHVAAKPADWQPKQNKTRMRIFGIFIESFSVGSVGAASKSKCECG